MQVIYNIFTEEYIIMLVGVFDQKKKISEVKNLSSDTECSFCILHFFCHHVMSSTQRVLRPPRPLISCTPVVFGDEGPLISFTQRHLWHSAALTSLIHQRCRPATGPLMKQLANQVARGNVDLWGRPSPRRQTHILSRQRVYLDHRHRPLPLLLPHIRSPWECFIDLSSVWWKPPAGRHSYWKRRFFAVSQTPVLFQTELHCDGLHNQY